MQRIAFFAAVFAATLLVGIGCQAEPVTGPNEPVPTATATALPAANTAPEDANDEPDRPPSPALRIWISEQLDGAVGRETAATDAALSSLIDAYAAEHPEVVLTVERKSADGPGSILNYLRHGRDVAPSILPDVVLLPSEASSTAATEQLLYPLDETLRAEADNTLLPVARTLSTVDDALIAYPVTLGSLPVVVFNGDVFSRTLPVTWSEMAQVETLELGMNVSTRGADLVTALYLSQGVPIQDENGNLMWDEVALTQALAQLQLARDSGVLSDATLSAGSAEDVWQLFETGSVNAIITTAEQLLLRYDELENARVSPVPGIDGPITPLVRAWSWSVTTPDPEQQALSAEFITQVTQTDLLDAFTTALPAPPASSVVFEQWPDDTILHSFLESELQAAQPFPAVINDETANLLQQAVSRILIVGESPETAAERIINRQ